MPLDKLKKDLSIYSDLIDFNALFIEFDLFYKIKDSAALNTFDKLVEHLRVKKYFRESFITSFPNILILINIYLTSPIANVTSERGFSCLKRVKTALIFKKNCLFSF